MKVAAIVVLYNPNMEVQTNILTYKDCFDAIYCVDNSDNDNFGKMIQEENIKYIPLFQNTGIAHALNVGCQHAIKDGCKYIITFDQDTYCPKETIGELLKKIEGEKETIFAPNIKYILRDENGQRIFSDLVVYKEQNVLVNWVITSGTTFSVETYKAIGGFDDKLFIGQVDQEFCYLHRMSGGEIVRIGDYYIYQELGNTTIKKFFFVTLHVPNLNAMRYYYLFRNEHYLRRKWGSSYRDYKVTLYKYLFSILLYEENKREKLFACMRGWRDFSKM